MRYEAKRKETEEEGEREREKVGERERGDSLSSCFECRSHVFIVAYLCSWVFSDRGDRVLYKYQALNNKAQAAESDGVLSANLNHPAQSLFSAVPIQDPAPQPGVPAPRTRVDEEAKVCASCGAADAVFFCRCGVRYCGKACQERDWPEHRRSARHKASKTASRSAVSR